MRTLLTTVAVLLILKGLVAVLLVSARHAPPRGVPQVHHAIWRVGR